MKRKTTIITLVLLITILLIGTLKYLIKKDTDQIQKDRLRFYSENLTIQKNTVLNTFRNSSNLVIEGLNYNPKLLDQLKLLNHENIPDKEELFKPIINESLSYFQHLEEVGFSFFAYSVCTSENNSYRISITDSLTKFDLSANPCHYFKQSDDISFPTLFYDKKNLKFKYSYPIPVNEKSPTVFMEAGFNFSLLRDLIKKNLTGSFIGLLFIGDSPSAICPPEPDIEFIQPDNKKQLFLDKQLVKEIDNYLSSNNLNKIFSRLINNNETVADQNISIYLLTNQKPKAISFSHLNLNNTEGNFYLVSVNNDSMLDKINDWNNQIFIINLIIIILIMFGITYLFINRISLLKEKKFIEESELKLKVMNESKDKFFSIIAHDLKNPFNGIMGMTGYLNENYGRISDKERKEIINDLNISSKNAFNLLQNLLEWTRTQSGTIKNIPVKIQPLNIIEIALETVGNLAKSKDITIKQNINTKLHGYADENLVTTILRNLLTNAVKFSPRKSAIEIIVKDYENELVFCVKDKGIGLKHDEIDQLFRIDTNFHKKGTEEETGTGLGLKVCKEFVEYCNGRIWVVSEPLSGSCFYFTIPIYSI